MAARAVRVAALSILVLSAAWNARADWLIAPFVGGAFGGETTFLDLERGASSTQVVFGVAGLWLSDQILGVEADLSYAPGFFNRGNLTLVTSSRAAALSGNVVIAVPLSVTQESLRPYLSAGLGLLHAGLEEPLGIASDEQTMFAMSAGGGAIGMITNRTGLRFDFRQLRSFDRDQDPLTLRRRARLSFWRATIGVLIRY